MKIALGLLLAAASVPAHSGPIWGKAEAGATLDQIKNLYPYGEEVVPDDQFNIGTGAVLRFKIGGVSVLGDKYDANFYFQNGSLEQVNLVQKRDTPDADCDSRYGSLITALSGKYGSPVNVKGRIPSAQLAQSTFSSGENIVSTFAQAINDKCSINIFYKTKKTGSSVNL